MAVSPAPWAVNLRLLNPPAANPRRLGYRGLRRDARIGDWIAGLPPEAAARLVLLLGLPGRFPAHLAERVRRKSQLPSSKGDGLWE